MAIDLHYVRKSVSSKKKPSTSIEKQMDGCAMVSKTAGVQYEVFCDAEGHRSGRSETKRPE